MGSAGDLTPRPNWVPVLGSFDDPKGMDFRQTFPDIPSAMNYGQDMRGLESYFVMLATNGARPERKPRKPPRPWSSLSARTKARWKRAGVSAGTYNAGRWTNAQADVARGAPRTPGHPLQALRDPVRFAAYIDKHKQGLADLLGVSTENIDDRVRAATTNVQVHLYVDTAQQGHPKP